MNWAESSIANTLVSQYCHSVAMPKTSTTIGTSGQILHKAASPQQINRIRQLAPMCPPTWRIRSNLCMHYRHLANTIEVVLPQPTRVHNSNGKLIGSAVFAQLTAESPYTL